MIILNKVRNAIYIEDAQDCNFGLTIKCTGFDTAVKVRKSKNVSFKEVIHVQHNQYNILYISIINIIYSI